MSIKKGTFVTPGQAIAFMAVCGRGLDCDAIEREELQALIDDALTGPEFMRWVKNGCRLTVAPVVIDRDRELNLPEGWELLPPEKQIASRATGKFTANPTAQVSVYLHDDQRTGDGISSINLQLALDGQVVERATTLVQFTANPASVPEQMKDGRTYIAWGDFILDGDGNLRVYSFTWNDDRPYLHSRRVDRNFNTDRPALLGCPS